MQKLWLRIITASAKDFEDRPPNAFIPSHHHIFPLLWTWACVLRVFPYFSPPYPLRQHLSLCWKLVAYLDLLARAANSEEPPISTPLALELLHTLPHLAWLFFFFFHVYAGDSNSGPSALCIWGISPAHIITSFLKVAVEHACTKVHILLEVGLALSLCKGRCHVFVMTSVVSYLASDAPRGHLGNSSSEGMHAGSDHTQTEARLGREGKPFRHLFAGTGRLCQEGAQVLACTFPSVVEAMRR